MENYKIINARIVLPEKIIEGSVEISGGIIKSVSSDNSASGGYTVIDASGRYLLPGFIDVHTNGIAGFDLTSGVYDLQKQSFVCGDDVYMEGLDNALKEFAATGVTKALLTSLAAPLDQLKKVFSLVNRYRSQTGSSIHSAVLGGLYVEGTFMKLDDYRGAHNPDYFYEPSIELFEELYEASGGIIKVVNVVPEWEEPAYKLIEYLTGKNIISAAGHTGAPGILYEKAISNGLNLAVHFLNVTGSLSKPFDGGGAVENVLKSRNMFVELIVDGYHVDKSYILDTIKRKGFSKVIAITDSMFAARMEGLKEFNVFGVHGIVSDNQEYLQIVDRPNALFGSKLTMDAAFSNLVTWLTTPIEGVWHEMHEPLPVEKAVVMASLMCSGNPARLLGCYDYGSNGAAAVGSIQPGKSADILLADLKDDNKTYKLEIDDVFIGGRQVRYTHSYKN